MVYLLLSFWHVRFLPGAGGPGEKAKKVGAGEEVRQEQHRVCIYGQRLPVESTFRKACCFLSDLDRKGLPKKGCLPFLEQFQQQNVDGQARVFGKYPKPCS